MEKKVWTPHEVKAGEQINYADNAHGLYAHVYQSFDVIALEDGIADTEVLATLKPREVSRRLKGRYCGQCGRKIGNITDGEDDNS